MTKLFGLILSAALSFQPTDNDYPRHYLVYDCLHYKVLTESDHPQWYYDEGDEWLYSEEYRSERELLSVDTIERIQ